MQYLRRLFARGHPPDSGAPRPAEPLAVVGDIHGRADLLDKLLTRLETAHPDARRIFVGDYVDRGPDSRAVLDRLQSLPDALCLRGNHEEMLLDFLDCPGELAERWLRNGGRQTLASYGIDLTEDVAAANAAFASALSDGTADWLRALPLYWQSGNVVVTHAGPNPAEQVAGQPDSVFTWGHSRFLRQPRGDGLWVAHGHWVQERANATEGRIAVDTGAVFTGRLTAAIIEPSGTVEFATVRG